MNLENEVEFLSKLVLPDKLPDQELLDYLNTYMKKTFEEPCFEVRSALKEIKKHLSVHLGFVFKQIQRIMIVAHNDNYNMMKKMQRL